MKINKNHYLTKSESKFLEKLKNAKLIPSKDATFTDKNLQKIETLIKLYNINSKKLRNHLNQKRTTFNQDFKTGINIKQNKIIIILDTILLIILAINVLTSHQKITNIVNIIYTLLFIINGVSLAINIRQYLKNHKRYMKKSEYIEYLTFQNFINDLYSFQKTKTILKNMKK